MLYVSVVVGCRCVWLRLGLVFGSGGVVVGWLVVFIVYSLVYCLVFSLYV